MVPNAISITGRLIGLVLSMVLVACQGSDLTLPADGQPSSLEEVSGSGQQGTVGSELPKPLVVKVTDGAARPLSQVSVRFQTEVPGAEIPAEVMTNDTGYAEVRVQLGDIEGTQTFDAQVADASELSTTFAVIAVPNQPADNGGNGGGGQGGGEDRDNGGGGGNGNGGGHDDHDDDDHGHGHGHDHDDDEDDD